MFSPAPKRALFGLTGLAFVLMEVLIHVAPARAVEHPHATLRYERASGAEACADDATLRSHVIARLGYDPFKDGQSPALRARVQARANGFEAQLSQSDAGSPKNRTQVLKSGDLSCSELTDALALAISIAIDPLSALAVKESKVTPAPAPAPVVNLTVVPPTPSTPSVPTPRADQEPNTRRAPVRRYLAAMGAGVSYAAVPAAAPSLRLSLGLGRDKLVGAVEARADLSATERSAQGSVSAALWLGSMLGCFHLRGPFACGVGSLGVMQGRGTGVDHPREARTLYASAGIRAGYQWHLIDRFSLAAHAELDLPLRRTVLQIDGQDAWTTPSIASAFLLAVVSEL